MKSKKPKKVSHEQEMRKQALMVLEHLIDKIRSGEATIVSAGEWGNNQMDTSFTTHIIWKENKK